MEYGTRADSRKRDKGLLVKIFESQESILLDSELGHGHDLKIVFSGRLFCESDELSISNWEHVLVHVAACLICECDILRIELVTPEGNRVNDVVLIGADQNEGEGLRVVVSEASHGDDRVNGR